MDICCGSSACYYLPTQEGRLHVHSTYLATSPPRHLATLPPRYLVTSLPCHLATLPPRYLVTSLPCHLATLPPRYLVTSLPCHLGPVQLNLYELASCNPDPAYPQHPRSGIAISQTSRYGWLGCRYLMRRIEFSRKNSAPWRTSKERISSRRNCTKVSTRQLNVESLYGGELRLDFSMDVAWSLFKARTWQRWQFTKTQQWKRISLMGTLDKHARLALLAVNLGTTDVT
jgi:hypothetical protein